MWKSLSENYWVACWCAGNISEINWKISEIDDTTYILFVNLVYMYKYVK